ncbi:MAG: hypothetical protein F2911_03075, partial [Actinobacteria bacterium]|nr:hypothetical protein [Actinomycetota bacterium]
MSRIFSPTLDGRFAPVHVIGMAATEFVPEHDAALDELVFAAMSAALAECGLRKQDLGLSVQASLDVYDGRSISSGLTTAAAGGYLSDSYRIEGDGGLAITAAAQAVASGDVDVAAAVAVFNPEISGSPERRRAFLEQLSSLAFEPLFDRPVGMTAQTSWALHAAKAVEAGEMSIHDLAALAAEEISRGASRRSVRSGPITADDVLASAALAWPLHELMLPAPSAGAAAVILAAPARAARAIGRSLVITGLGHGTGDYT